MKTEIYIVGWFIHVKKTEDGKARRYTIAPGSDISNEPQEVQDVCNAAWTPEFIKAYEDHKAAQD